MDIWVKHSFKKNKVCVHTAGDYLTPMGLGLGMVLDEVLLPPGVCLVHGSRVAW